MTRKQGIIMAGSLPLVTVLVGVLYLVLKPKSDVTTTEVTSKKKLVGVLDNQVPLSDRPFVRIIPQPDGHNLELKLVTLPKSASGAEYELEYQAGNLLQGAFGRVNTTALPSAELVLLGSCSAGGACNFHNDVKGGSLRLIFEAQEPYAVKGDWNFTTNSKKETAFSSRDAKFQVTSPALAGASYVVVYQTPGYPEGLSAKVVSQPYNLEWTKPISGSATISIRAESEGELTIQGWDGTSWHSFDTISDGKTATAEVDLMQLYLVTG